KCGRDPNNFQKEMEHFFEYRYLLDYEGKVFYFVLLILKTAFLLSKIIKKIIMKKSVVFLSILMLFAFKTKESSLTQQERDFASKFLKDTEQGVFDSVKDLSEAQLKYKPAADKWSVEECVKHIAISERNLWGMVEGSLKQPVNGEKRADIKLTDEQVVKGTEDRTNKVKTFDALKPENTPYKSVAEALASFKENREKLVAFVSNSKEDLRNHVSVLPMGTYDAYQLILLISAHSNRHTQQIEEVKANANFPKS
ncbi:MAG: hypothetical protein JWQ09_1398, partial [Segetibacter sp.]|nr:hypothetical protein [Segetibacter sp.]